MAKIKKTPPVTKKVQEDLSPLSLLHKPHDKYVRFVLQSREVALEIIQFALEPHVLATIDLESITLSDESFIDDQMREHISDICYTGQTKDGEPIRIVIIFEHKSTKPTHPIIEQLIRYIAAQWSKDVMQQRPLSLPIPILIYHDDAPIAKETPTSVFSGAPESLLKYVPSFDYELVDIARIPDSILSTMGFLLLRNIFLALKYGRDDKFVEKNWKSILIFAPEIRETELHLRIFQATFLYMNKISPTFSNKIENMDTVLSATEKDVVKPYITRLYEQAIEEGIEKGIEQGIEKGREQGLEQGLEQGREQGLEEGMKKLLRSFIQKNPNLSLEEVAALHDVDIRFVKEVADSKQ